MIDFLNQYGLLRPDRILFLFAPVFVGLIVLEYLFFLRAGRRTYSVRDSLNNFVLSFGFQASELLLQFLNYAFMISMGQYLYEHGLKLIDLEIQKGMAWFFTLLSLIILQDFLYYWFHRASHRVWWFWTAHVTHHSSEHLNFSTALRQSIFYPVVGMWLFWLPLMAVGFKPELVSLVVALNLVFQFFVHTEWWRSWGIFEKVLNTPSHHRVHHAKNVQYIDKNYAGLLIIWDKIFGTFEPEDEHPVYGITRPTRYDHYLHAQTDEWRHLYHTVRATRGFWKKIRVVFGPPQ